jgi:purine-binding chemotaxis protein CheW
MGTYLTFRLGNELFASPVSKVLNILELCPITKVPMAPPHMIGVINLRGKVLPLIDARECFLLEKTSYTQDTCILVLDISTGDDTAVTGALVDAVNEVLEVNDSELLQPPNLGSKFSSEHITSVIKHGEQFIMLLDMDKVFSVHDKSEKAAI